MQENKYFYKNIPITKYCKDNDINIKTIRSRIWKLKNNPKYSTYTEQQIIDKAIETYGTAIKYTYKGMTLRQYCLKNDLELGTIVTRIKNIKKENPKMSTESATIMAIENFNNKNFRFFYQGMPLKDYCLQNPEISYNTIRGFINTEIERNPELSIEEAIELYLAKEHKGKYKYYYCGMPLVNYCKENNLKYENVMAYMLRHKKEEISIEMSDDDYVEIIMVMYEPFKLKYQYKGLSLREYCTQNSLSYSGILTYVKRKSKKNPELDIEQIIEEAINTVKKYGIIYYYNGIPLKDYCKEHNLNVDSIRSAIIRKKKQAGLSLQEIVNECVENYEKFEIKYTYQGMPLFSYCKKVGLNYNTVIGAYNKKIIENPDLNPEETLNEIIENYLENPPCRTKYYISKDKSQSLRNFCKSKGYSYDAIFLRIKLLEQKEIFEEENDLIMHAIEKYEKKLQIGRINNIFEKLKEEQNIEFAEIKNICEFLKINYENVIDLMNMDFSLNQAINLIWYFGDIKDQYNNKIITDNKLREIFMLVDEIKNAKEEEIFKFELYDLLGIYKSEIYDTRVEMLIRETPYFKSIIKKLCQEYNINIIKDNYEEYLSELKTYFIIMIDRSHLNEIKQIIKYMDLTVKGYFRKYLRNEKNNMHNVSLYEEQFKKDKGTKNSKKRVDYIVNKEKEPIESKFSEKIRRLLETVSEEEYDFIILKYQEEYNDEELAAYFNIDIDEVKEKDACILSKLKENYNCLQRKKERVIK